MLWTCGDEIVERYTLQMDQDGPRLQRAAAIDFRTVEGLADAQRPWFGFTDEVKPVVLSGRPLLLVTASGDGGVALVDASGTGSIVFAAPLPNAHSAELLPDGTIVAAGSIGSDRLVAYRYAGADAGAGTWTQWTDAPLPHAHGVVWDQVLGCIWAVGDATLVRMPLPGNGPWRPLQTIALPDRQAHELTPDPTTGDLIISTGRAVWRLRVDTGELAAFDELAGRPHIKSVSIDPQWGRLVMVADPGEWWSHGFDWTKAGQTRRVQFGDRIVYKVRWNRSHQRMAVSAAKQ